MIGCYPSNSGKQHSGLGQIIRCYLRRWRVIMRRLPVDLEMMLFTAVLWLYSLDGCGQNKTSTGMHLRQRSCKT